MTYLKPEINRLGNAVAAIQSDHVKTVQQVYDNPQHTTVGASPAYEADE